MRPKGFKHTKITKKKIGEALMGRKITWQDKIRESWTPELREKMSKLRRGDLNPAKRIEVRLKISEAKKGKPSWNKGKIFSLETRKKISKIARERVVNPFFGKYHTKETKRKMSESHKGKHLSLETRRKISESIRRENSPAWEGGKSFEPYTPEFNNQLKELIRFRDGYKCQKCGMPEIEGNRKLDIHHIDYNKKNCEPNNLITLCRKCNLEVNSNRSKWTKYFNKKIKKTMDSNKIQLNFRFKGGKKNVSNLDHFRVTSGLYRG